MRSGAVLRQVAVRCAVGERWRRGIGYRSRKMRLVELGNGQQGVRVGGVHLAGLEMLVLLRQAPQQGKKPPSPCSGNRGKLNLRQGVQLGAGFHRRNVALGSSAPSLQ